MSEGITGEADGADTDGKKKMAITPHINDIVSGRGSGSNRHEGNLYFRKLIRENKELYLSRPKNEKMLVARDIYNTIESLDPPGRFLQKNPETGSWFEIGKDRALEKISQALREKNSKQQTHHQPSHFSMGFPPHIHGLEQDRLNMPQPQYAAGINRMTSNAHPGYGIGAAAGPSIGGFDMAGNDLMAQRVQTNSYVSDSAMFERRIAELREARQQMMRGGGVPGGHNDQINQAQYQNAFLNSLDTGRNNLDLRRMDPSLVDSSLRYSSNFVNRQSSWLQESQPLPTLPDVPQNRFGNPPGRLFANNTNAGLSLLESERTRRLARQNEYLNSLSSSQGLSTTQGIASSQGISTSQPGGLNMYVGNSLIDSTNMVNFPSHHRTNQAPFLTPKQQQMELNNLIMQRQQIAENRQDFVMKSNNQVADKLQGNSKRKRKIKNVQPAKERTSESRRCKSSRSDISISSRSSLSSSIEPSSSADKEVTLLDANNKPNQEKGKLGKDQGLSNEPDMPPLKAGSNKNVSSRKLKCNTSAGESQSDGGESREQSPTAGLDALSKAASLMRR